jgi:uncharacterized protein YecT (DUF1311 family)
MQKQIKFLSIFAVLTLTAALTAQAADSDNCDIEAPGCLEKILKVQDQELNQVYQLALKALPEKDANDSRKARQQLVKSQRTWLKYRDANCAVVGGQEGGDNRWVSHFAALCSRKETQARIGFLKTISSGG